MGVVTIDPTFGDSSELLTRPIDLTDVLPAASAGAIVAEPLADVPLFDPVFDPRDNVVIYNPTTNQVTRFADLPAFAREAAINERPFPSTDNAHKAGFLDLIAAPFVALGVAADAATDSIDRGVQNVRSLLPWIVALAVLFVVYQGLGLARLFAASPRPRKRRARA